MRAATALLIFTLIVLDIFTGMNTADRGDIIERIANATTQADRRTGNRNGHPKNNHQQQTNKSQDTNSESRDRAQRMLSDEYVRLYHLFGPHQS